MTQEEIYNKLESILINAGYRLDLVGHLSDCDGSGNILYTSNVYRKHDAYYRLDMSKGVISINSKNGSRTIIADGHPEPFNFERFEKRLNNEQNDTN